MVILVCVISVYSYGYRKMLIVLNSIMLVIVMVVLCGEVFMVGVIVSMVVVLYIVLLVVISIVCECVR